MPLSLNTIQKPALRDFATSIAAEQTKNPAYKADAAVVDKIISLVGDATGTSAADLAATLKKGNFTPQEKLALAQKGMTAEEKADLKAIVSDANIAKAFDAVTLNFLQALVGIAPLQAIDTVGGASRVGGTDAPSPEKLAVGKMRDLIKSGQLQKYYDAAIGIGDASLKDEALKLFKSLPKIAPSVNANDMVANGFWTTAPRGIEEMQKSARYLPGRQVLAEVNINTDAMKGGDKFLSFDEKGPKGITYRATLAGEDPNNKDNFLVKVDGKADPVSVSKESIYRLNQPHVFEGDVINAGARVDYNDPFTKAKLAEAALKMSDLVTQLDFTKMKTEGRGNAISMLWGGSGAKAMSDIQRQCVRVIHDVIDMRYTDASAQKDPGRVSSYEGAGRAAVKGYGVCYDQAGVMLALLLPFRNLVGFDVQFVSGGVYRHLSASDSAEMQFRKFNSQAHGWLQLTYRPSMEMRICDRTWTQPDHLADKAYSRWGDRYPTTRYSNVPVAKLTDSDVNMSGKVSVATFDRQFGSQGVDGRDNHMSNWQNKPNP